MPDFDQERLNRYFSTTWLQRSRTLETYEYSGWALKKKIDASELVLDVGCGNNPFKGHLKVLGIDPANPNADIMVTIEEFHSDTLFDVALCLGSINFGNEAHIRRQIAATVSHLQPTSRIYWRCNPGRHDHRNSEFEEIEVFPWRFDHHEQFATESGFCLKDCRWDTNNRIYAEWVRT